MILELETRNLPLPSAVLESTRQCIAQVLRAFLAEVSRVECSIREIYPSHGTLDRRCSLWLYTRTPASPIIVHGRGKGTCAAVEAASRALSEALYLRSPLRRAGQHEWQAPGGSARLAS
jgi:hypothetical protein